MFKSSLIGLRAGVCVREPDNTEHPIQNSIEAGLVERGVALFGLRRKAVLSILRDGVWQDNIAAGVLDFAVIGKVIVRQEQWDVYTFPTVQHVHTASGQLFSRLPKDDPDYRVPNDFNSYLVGTMILANAKLLPQEAYYNEADAQYALRREQEKVLTGHKIVTVCTLDARFYGPDGRIHGSFNMTAKSNEVRDPVGWLAGKLVDQLANTAAASIAVHTHTEIRTGLGIESQAVSDAVRRMQEGSQKQL